MPRVNISDSSDLELPKVVFGPSTVLNNDEFNLDEYNKAREGTASAGNRIHESRNTGTLLGRSILTMELLLLSFFRFRRLPAAVLFAKTTADVIAAVNCARVNGFKVSPRGRGHDYNALSTLDASLVIDMQLNCKMENFEADRTVSGKHILPGSRYIGRMKVPSGCTNAVFLAAVYKEFKDDGGMTVVGQCPSVQQRISSSDSLLRDCCGYRGRNQNGPL